uniref:Archaemetzincin-2 n=1 Tax=Eutreptiella gymnastica TaxID=73025 RepID=A0A7S1NID1_9EUGL
MTDAGLSRPLPKPRPGDWLREHAEPGQTLRQFHNTSFRIVPHGAVTTLLLQPIGDYLADPVSAPPLPLLAAYLQAFFGPGVDVRVTKPVALERIPNLTTRVGPEGLRQVLVGDLYAYLGGVMKSKDRARTTLATVGVTMEDLYPGDKWNFVYGEANPMDAVGVFSFARYHPSFTPTTLQTSPEVTMLLRSCKVLSHEVGHLAGLKHCVHFHCIMNGANHARELEQQPLQLCPLCLKKLAGPFHWDIAARSKALEAFYAAHGFPEAVAEEQRLQAYFGTK